ncbi:MAG: sigma-54-dependent transcriptional regulator [Spirochaetota bacterium]
MARVVVLDADVSSYRVIKHLLEPTHRVGFFHIGGSTLDYVREQTPDIVFLALDSAPTEPMEVLSTIVGQFDRVSIVAIIHHLDVGRIVDAVRRGACDVIRYPMHERDLQLAVTRALARQQVRDEQHAHGPIPEIIGVSSVVARMRAHIARIADGFAPVVITGESGVGKELVAQAIHKLSSCADGPFEARNCGALPETLIESELFGTERGAYTDAVQRPGAFGLADGGTIFLDEIAELSPIAQVKLLRVLETGRYHRVGGTRSHKTTARFVAATHRNLRELMKRGLFREDLYYRIDVFRIAIPPLRERREDIPLIVEHFLRLLRDEGVRTRANTFSPAALQRLTTYPWPGNVRELRNVVWRAMTHAAGPVIQPSELSFS